MSREAAAPSRLSVVVTIVDGGATLERCLRALREQDEAEGMEVIVPFDDSVAGMDTMALKFPDFRFLALGTLPTSRPTFSAAGQHELFDRRRAAGLGAATADLVAILEDRGVPSPAWAGTVVGLHQRLPHAVIGGAIDNGREATLNWAVYFCDFGRYQPPFEAGPRPYVSDVNICYKRRALETTRDLWRERYHETTVHWALQRAGETLFLSPEFVVFQMRDGLKLRALLAERLDWGRLFAYTRAREISGLRRLFLAGLTPVLPAVLLVRLARHQLAKRRTLASFVRAAPAVLLLLAGWSAGELVGYLTEKP